MGFQRVTYPIYTLQRIFIQEGHHLSVHTTPGPRTHGIQKKPPHHKIKWFLPFQNKIQQILLVISLKAI